MQAWDGGEAVVVRPTITYGADDQEGMLARALKLMSRGMRMFPGTGENRIHLLHVDDLVRGLVAAGAGGGEGVYVMGGPQADRVRDILSLLAQGAGLPDPSFGLPAGVLEPLGALAETAWAVTRRHGRAAPHPPLDRRDDQRPGLLVGRGRARPRLAARDRHRRRRAGRRRRVRAGPATPRSPSPPPPAASSASTGATTSRTRTRAWAPCTSASPSTTSSPTRWRSSAPPACSTPRPSG